MNIIIGEEQARQLSDRHTVLPLDQFKLDGQDNVVRSYCVVSAIPLAEMYQAEHWSALHIKLMDNYCKKNWNFCQQAIEHLMGKWNGELDSFYLTLLARINQYQADGVDDTWSPVIAR